MTNEKAKLLAEKIKELSKRNSAFLDSEKAKLLAEKIKLLVEKKLADIPNFDPSFILEKIANLEIDVLEKFDSLNFFENLNKIYLEIENQVRNLENQQKNLIEEKNAILKAEFESFKAIVDESITEAEKNAIHALEKQKADLEQKITENKPKDGKNGKDGSPDTPEEVKNKLETLKGEERLDAKAIKNLEKEIAGKIKVLGRNIKTGSSADEKVKLDNSDTTADFLLSKLEEIKLKATTAGTASQTFDVLYSPTGLEPVGSIFWNEIDGTFDFRLKNNATLQVGQELHFYGKASGNILNGDVVQFAGVQGDHILVKKAVGSEIDLHPEYLIGIATQNITNGTFGYCTWFGKVNGVFTTGFENGDVLYFNTTTSQLQNTQPDAPLRRIVVASVIKKATGSAENGILIVRPTWGVKIQDLDDVDGGVPTIGDILRFDGSIWQVSSDFSDHLLDTGNPHETSDENLLFSDTTTNNSSVSKHGFLPKLSGNSTEFLNGLGSFEKVGGSDSTKTLSTHFLDNVANPTTGNNVSFGGDFSFLFELGTASLSVDYSDTADLGHAGILACRNTGGTNQYMRFRNWSKSFVVDDIEEMEFITKYTRRSDLSGAANVLGAVGFGTTQTNVTSTTAGARFVLYALGATANWTFETANGTSKTVKTDITAQNNQWVKLKIVNNQTNGIDYFVNDVKIGTSTTNLPSGNTPVYYFGYVFGNYFEGKFDFFRIKLR